MGAIQNYTVKTIKGFVQYEIEACRVDLEEDLLYLCGWMFEPQGSSFAVTPEGFGDFVCLKKDRYDVLEDFPQAVLSCGFVAVGELIYDRPVDIYFTSTNTTVQIQINTPKIIKEIQNGASILNKDVRGYILGEFNAMNTFSNLMRGDYYREVWKNIKELRTPNLRYYNRDYAFYKYRENQIKPTRANVLSDFTRYDYKPTITIIFKSVDNIEESIKSITEQVYESYEIYVLGEIEDRWQNEKIHIENTTIKELLPKIKGEYVCIMEGGDLLDKFCLYHLYKFLNIYHNSAMVYVDEADIDSTGQIVNPSFKPSASPELLLSTNYIGKGAFFQRDLLVDTGFRGDYYETYLHFVKNNKRVFHLDKVLYYSRKRAKYSADTVAQFVQENAFSGKLKRYKNFCSFIPTSENDCPITAIIYGEGIVNITVPPNVQVIRIKKLVPTTLNVLMQKIVGQFVLFMDASVDFNSFEDVLTMKAWAVQRDIGAVGVKLMGKEVYSTGIALCGDTFEMNIGNMDMDKRGVHNLYLMNQNATAVSMKCLMVETEKLKRAGAFDPNVTTYIATDLCLRLRALGLRCVSTALVETIKDVERDMPNYREIKYFNLKWGESLFESYYPAKVTKGGNYYQIDYKKDEKNN